MKDTCLVIGVNQSRNEIGTTNWFSHGFDTSSSSSHGVDPTNLPRNSVDS